MSQIKQLLLLKKSGISNRKAADIIGMNKETVNNYMNKVSADSLSLDELIRLDDPILEHRLKGGNPAYSDKRFETFKALLPYLQEEMKRKHVTLNADKNSYISVRTFPYKFIYRVAKLAENRKRYNLLISCLFHLKILSLHYSLNSQDYE